MTENFIPETESDELTIAEHDELGTDHVCDCEWDETENADGTYTFFVVEECAACAKRNA